MDTPVIRTAGAILVLGLAFLIQTRSIPAFFSSVGPASNEPSGQMLEIQAWREASEYKRALAPAQLLYNRHPQNHIYIQQLAEIQGALGHYQQEADLWEQFMQSAPTPVDGCPQIGVAYIHANRNDRAIRALDRCVAMEAKNPDILYYLGYAYDRMGQQEKAADYYAKGLAIDPKDVDLNIGMGRLDLQKGNIDEAMRLGANALERFPDNSDALLLAGLAAMRNNDLAAAHRHLDRAEQLSANYADVHLALGQLADRENNPARALLEYKLALQYNPAEPIALKRAAELESGKK